MVAAVLTLVRSQAAIFFSLSKVKKLMETGKYKFTVLDGSGLRTSYDLEATPKVVLLDSEGIVKLSCLGWGQETQQEIIREIRKVFQE